MGSLCPLLKMGKLPLRKPYVKCFWSIDFIFHIFTGNWLAFSIRARASGQHHYRYQEQPIMDKRMYARSLQVVSLCSGPVLFLPLRFIIYFYAHKGVKSFWGLLIRVCTEYTHFYNLHGWHRAQGILKVYEVSHSCCLIFLFQQHE